MLSRYTEAHHLLGFLSCRRPTPGRQTEGDTPRILRLPHAVALGHSEERFDGIGTDGQAEMIEPSGLGGGKLVLQIGLQLLAHRGRGHLADQGLTLGQGVMGESLGLETLLTCQHALGITLEALEAGLTRRQLIQASPQADKKR